MSSIAPNLNDIAFWGALKNSVRGSIDPHVAELDDRLLAFLTFSILCGLEERRIGVVPMVPTSIMLVASMSALRRRKLPNQWLSTKAKHRIRLRDAIGAAPDWKAAFRAERDARSRNLNQS